MSEELEVLKEVASRLNDSRIPYMISGSVAMSFHAQPRMTRDIDIVIALDENDITRFVDLFKDDFYVDEEMIRTETSRRGMFNLIQNKFVIKIDFILQKDGEFDHMSFERRKEADVDGMGIWIISAEDLALRKLLWAQESLSELQIRDVQNILDSARDFDTDYVDKWVKKLGLKDIFEKARTGG